MKMNFLLKKMHVPLLIGFALLVLLLPLILRFFAHYPLSHSSEAYAHLRISSLIQERGLIQHDPFLNQPYTFNLYDYLLAALSYLFPSAWISILLPLALGVGAILFFYLFLCRLTFSRDHSLLISLLVVLSPAYIYTFTTLTSLSLLLFLTLLGFYLFLRAKTYSAYFSWSLLVLIHWSGFIALCALLAWYLYLYQRNKMQTLLYVFSLGFLVWIFLVMIYPFSFQSELSPFNLWARFYVTDFGATLGYSFITLILSFFYLIHHRDKKPFFLFLIFLFSVISLPSRLLFALVLTMGAGAYILNLIERPWCVLLLKQLTLILIACLFLFANLSYTNRLIHSAPEAAAEQVLLKLSLDKPGLVLSPPDQLDFVSYFAQKKAITLYDNLTDLNQVYYSQRLDITKKTLNQYQIRYILLTPSMINGGVWKEPDQGLLLLLHFSESFIKRYAIDGIEIWEYRGYEGFS
ncbi:MAG: hypothetical protein AABX70_08690 [Nanoarchaeota archaeon]